MRRKKSIIAFLVLQMLICVCFACNAASVYADEENSVKIQSFHQLEYDDMFVYPSDKMNEKEVSQYMPEYLEAEDSSGNVINVPVEWTCSTGDYESTDYYCYQFSPVWDNEKYVYDDADNIMSDGPYVFVCLGERFDDDSELARASENGDKNASKIFKYLTENMGLSSTAACGVVANIYHESGCIADLLEIGYTWTSGGGYGICQWTNTPRTAESGRRSSLVKYCGLIGKDYKTISGQLKYLEYELTTSYSGVLNSLKDINVSADSCKDCYDAAYIWCTRFEVPQNMEATAVVRGNFAKSLWESYSSNAVNTRAPKFTGNIYPESIMQGKGYPVKGVVSATSGIIKKVKVAVVNSASKTICSKSAVPGSMTYDISALDPYITFDKLTNGVYFYRVSVTTNDGTYTLLNKDFVVCPNEPVKVNGLKESKKGVTSVKITWKKAEGVTGYYIMRADSPDGTYKKIATITGYDNTEYADKGLKKYGMYYYKICSFITRDGVTKYSKYSGMATAGTKLYPTSMVKKIKKTTVLRKYAGVKYSKITNIKAGSRVRLVNRTKDSNGAVWYYVKYGTKYGYIKFNVIA